MFQHMMMLMAQFGLAISGLVTIILMTAMAVDAACDIRKGLLTRQSANGYLVCAVSAAIMAGVTYLGIVYLFMGDCV
jgi:hypothetical protein